MPVSTSASYNPSYTFVDRDGFADAGTSASFDLDGQDSAALVRGQSALCEGPLTRQFPLARQVEGRYHRATQN